MAVAREDHYFAEYSNHNAHSQRPGSCWYKQDWREKLGGQYIYNKS